MYDYYNYSSSLCIKIKGDLGDWVNSDSDNFIGGFLHCVLCGKNVGQTHMVKSITRENVLQNCCTIPSDR